jgi:hypothetical protein
MHSGGSAWCEPQTDRSACQQSLGAEARSAFGPLTQRLAHDGGVLAMNRSLYFDAPVFLQARNERVPGEPGALARTDDLTSTVLGRSLRMAQSRLMHSSDCARGPPRPFFTMSGAFASQEW